MVKIINEEENKVLGKDGIWYKNRSGKNNPMFGKKRLDLSERNRKNWQDIEFKEKMQKIFSQSYERRRQKTILRNKTNNSMWNLDNVKKSVENRNYEFYKERINETKRKNGTYLEYSERMKRSNPMKNPVINAKVNKNPDVIKKRIQALIKTPNKKEQILISLIKENRLNYTFVGDGRVIIGTKNPDFINLKNKKIIELFGDYWHTARARVYEETEEGRINYFKKFGFKTLIIWERELKDSNRVLKKIANFNHPTEKQ